ncbi:Sec-independent protein translocase subunit TatA [Actinomadura napierensis]|uniref:Sec-independent protein translocase protein TatA n=1 Tax=Actinomadura napierensis TaxID=267854 RepID=A0ABP5JZY0_9ACTN
MGELAPWHWLIVGLVFMLLFGAKKLPDAARSLGQSVRILRAETRGPDEHPQAVPDTVEDKLRRAAQLRAEAQNLEDGGEPATSAVPLEGGRR